MKIGIPSLRKREWRLNGGRNMERGKKSTSVENVSFPGLFFSPVF